MLAMFKRLSLSHSKKPQPVVDSVAGTTPSEPTLPLEAPQGAGNNDVGIIDTVAASAAAAGSADEEIGLAEMAKTMNVEAAKAEDYLRDTETDISSADEAFFKQNKMTRLIEERKAGRAKMLVLGKQLVQLSEHAESAAIEVGQAVVDAEALRQQAVNDVKHKAELKGVKLDLDQILAKNEQLERIIDSAKKAIKNAKKASASVAKAKAARRFSLSPRR